MLDQDSLVSRASGVNYKKDMTLLSAYLLNQKLNPPIGIWRGLVSLANCFTLVSIA